MSFSNSCQKKICQYLTSINQNEKQQEAAKQVFCNNTYFQIQTCFNRIDKFKKGYLIPSDFTEFMLENRIICNEEEVYLVFRDFDLKRNGRVTLEDFTQIILPRENNKLKKDTLKRKFYDVIVRLDVELEFQLGKYFNAKLQGFKIRRSIIDQLFGFSEFTVQKVFNLISHNQPKIPGFDNIDEFLRKNGICLKNEDFRRILNSLNFNKTTPLDAQTFQDHLDPFKFGFYPAYKVQLADRIEQKSKYQRIVNARDLLHEQKALNNIQANRLYIEYNALKNDNLRRSRIELEQDRQRILYNQQQHNNLRLSRQIDRQTYQINRLALTRSRLLEDEYLLRRPLYFY